MPPENPVSAAHTCPASSVNAGPPAFTRMGTNPGCGATRLTVAEAVALESATLLAITVICWSGEITAGAVYNPLAETVPNGALSDQVTAALALPLTAAVNCWLPDRPRVTALGVRPTVTAPVATISMALICGSSASPRAN